MTWPAGARGRPRRYQVTVLAVVAAPEPSDAVRTTTGCRPAAVNDAVVSAVRVLVVTTAGAEASSAIVPFGEDLRRGHAAEAVEAVDDPTSVAPGGAGRAGGA